MSSSNIQGTSKTTYPTLFCSETTYKKWNKKNKEYEKKVVHKPTTTNKHSITRLYGPEPEHSLIVCDTSDSDTPVKRRQKKITNKRVITTDNDDILKLIQRVKNINC